MRFAPGYCPSELTVMSEEFVDWIARRTLLGRTPTLDEL